MSNALAVVSPDQYVMRLQDESIRAAMVEEMDAMTVTFDIAKVPSGGSTAFEIPGDDPNSPDMVKALVGVIVDHYAVNAYWQDKYNGSKNPPDCSSMDGKTGTTKDGKQRVCATCPLNQFGSDPDGRGKACKNMRRVFLLPSSSILPLQLTVPPTSLRNFNDYIAKRIVAKGLRSLDVLTKVTLTKATNKGGIEYSQAVFTLAGRLSAATAEAMRAYAEQAKATTRRVNIIAEEFEASQGSGDEAPF